MLCLSKFRVFTHPRPVSDRWSGRRPFSLTPLSVQPSLKRHPLQYRDNGLCFPVWSDQAVIELPEDSSCADKSATPLCASRCACRNPLDPGRSLVSTCPVSVRIAVWTGEEMRERGSGIRKSSDLRAARLIQAATASRVVSVISNCTGRWVFCCMMIARADTRPPCDTSRTRSAEVTCTELAVDAEIE